MLRFFSFGSVRSLVACASLLFAANAHTVLAPADQYFGPNKLSVVGMHTAIVNLGKRYHARDITDTDVLHDAKIVEAAIYRWHETYPKDMGAIATAFSLEQLYQTVQSTNAHTHAMVVLKFIAKAAPKSPQAHLSRLRLAQGFPPLATESATHATPDPYAREANGASSPPVAAASTMPSVQSTAGASATADAATQVPASASPTAGHG